MSRTMLPLAVAILISLPCAAVADPYPNMPGPGATPQRPSLRQIFNWLDTNHDGFLSLQEFLAAPWVKNKQRGAQFFRWMDTNNDGRVSLGEFLAANSRYFGDEGYDVRVVYPWAWNCWRPWRYGWYWQDGWRRRPGFGPGYADGPHPYVGHRHAYVGHPHHGAKHGGHGAHHPAKHAKSHHGPHKGHAHHGHGGHRGHGGHHHAHGGHGGHHGHHR